MNNILGIVLGGLIGINVGLFYLEGRALWESSRRLAEIKDLQDAVEANVKELRAMLGELRVAV